MRKILALAGLLAVLSFHPVYADNVVVDDVSGVFDNSTGIAVGIVPPGQNNVTTFPHLNSNGGLSIGTAGAPPTNGLFVQGTSTLHGAVTADSTLGATGLITATAGMNSANNLTMTVATKGLVLKQGANGRTGTFVCTSGGDITVGNTGLAAGDVIAISLSTAGGTVSTPPAVKSFTASTGFHALCATSDTSTYSYALIATAP